MPERLHVFDLDDTLVPGVLAERAFWQLADAGYVDLPSERIETLAAQRQQLMRPDGSFGSSPEADSYIWATVDATIDGTKGVPMAAIRRLARDQAEQDAEKIFAPMRDVLKVIAASGDATAIISGSIDHFVHPLARQLGINVSTGSRFYTARGAIHRARPPEARHSNKEVLVRSIAKSLGATAYAGYGDSMRDFSMLLAVQHPHAVNPSPELRAQAIARAWPIIEV